MKRIPLWIPPPTIRGGGVKPRGKWKTWQLHGFNHVISLLCYRKWMLNNESCGYLEFARKYVCSWLYDLGRSRGDTFLSVYRFFHIVPLLIAIIAFLIAIEYLTKFVRCIFLIYLRSNTESQQNKFGAHLQIDPIYKLMLLIRWQIHSIRWLLEKVC